MDKVREAGVIAGRNVTQEQIDRVLGITKPLAEVLLNLSTDDMHNVMGSLLMSYGLRFDDPVGAIEQLASIISAQIPIVEQEAGHKQ